jgi:hypothetical protein
MASPAHGIILLLQVGDQGFHLALVRQEELDVVPAGEAEVAVAVLVGKPADLADVVGAQQPGRAHSHAVELLSRFGHMFQDAGFEDFVVLPLAVILLNHGGQHFFIVRGSDVGLGHGYFPPFLISSGQKNT